MENIPTLRNPGALTGLDLVLHYEEYLKAADTKLRKIKQQLENLKEGHERWLTLVLEDPENQAEQGLYDAMLQEVNGIPAVIANAEDQIVTLEAEIAATTRLLNRILTPVSLRGPPAEPAPPVAPTLHVPAGALQLPKFSGDISKWSSFWSTFEVAVDQVTQLPDIYKLTTLINLLEGTAKRAVEGYMIIPANYGVIKDVLHKRFDKPDATTNMLMDQLQMLPHSTQKSLPQTVAAIERILRQLTALNTDVNHPLVVSIVEKKLPPPLLAEVIRLKDKDPQWDLDKLRKMLQEIVTSREYAAALLQEDKQSLHHSKTNLERSVPHRPIREEPTSALTALRPQSPKVNKVKRQVECRFCGEHHYDSACDKYATYETRIARAKEQKRCLKCLKVGHFSKECRLKPQRCYYCSGKHHLSALCRNKFGQSQKKKSTATHSVTEPPNLGTQESAHDEVVTANATVQNHTASEEKVLLMCRETGVLNLEKPEKEERAVVFLDPGSQNSYIEEALAERLEATPLGPKRDMLVASFGNKQLINRPTVTVKLGMKLNSGEIKVLSLNTVPYITKQLQMVAIEPNEIKHHLVSNCLHNRSVWKQPRILIGMDYWHEFAGTVRPLRSGFKLMESKIGPIITGKGLLKAPKYQSLIQCSAIETDVDAFWSLETVGITDNPNQNDDDVAWKNFQDTVTKRQNRYVIRWPWRQPQPRLANNVGLCLGRLRSLWNKLKSKKGFLEQYHEIVTSQEKQGVIEKVDLNHVNGLIHYLPHQPVVNLLKPSTKLRIVYDASAHTCGASLNEALCRGPVLLPDMCGMLLRWRQQNIAIVADIEKAFLQIEIDEQDRNVTRFFWLKDPRLPPEKDNLVTYRFCRLPFGLICSPFLLAAVLTVHLQNYELGHELLRNTYVDNIVLTTATEGEAVRWYATLKKIFGDAKMNVRQFASNNISVMNKIPEEDCLTDADASVLGLIWNLKEDTIKLENKKWQNQTCTKRSILSFIHSHFDPLGLMSPTLVPLKRFEQSLWVQKREWDEILPQHESETWNKVIQQFKPVPFEIKRQVVGKKITELHVFTDASETAIGAAVYTKTNEKNTANNTNLVFAKSRLMPIKPLSMPKAELVAALIGARAIKFVQRSLGLESTVIVGWSDSKCVLYWLRQSGGKPLPVFIRNRIKEIQTLGVHFQYVPSKQNLADIASRGCTPLELTENILWWHGPQYLKYAKEEWPPDIIIKPTEIEEQLGKIERKLPTKREKGLPSTEPNIVMFAQDDPAIKDLVDATRFSSWKKTVNTTVHVLLFLYRIKNNLHTFVGIPDRVGKSALWKLAEKILIKQAQFSITDLEIKRWCLSKDEEGIWRVADRLSNMSAHPHPIYLPRNDRLTQLLILQEHETQGHAGVAHTLANFRLKYWIEKGRNTARKLLNKECYLCRKWRAVPFRLPRMASLPMKRVQQATPFAHTAIDYAGPVQIKESNNQLGKRWICHFTCLVTRAIHLEVAIDLSTPTFLACFKRFVARRGRPSSLLSDNGSQFLAAARYVTADWRNITAHAPWKGGVYERMIGLMKGVLRKSIGKRLLNHEQLVTILIEAEGILNSRPLCQLPNESNEVLRPMDFLIPKISIDDQLKMPDPEDYLPGLPKNRSQVIKFFQKTEECRNKLWNIWQRDYLQYLREKAANEHKQGRSTSQQIPRVGEIVLVEFQEEMPRGQWPLAQITQLIPSSDGEIRSATVRFPSGRTTTRPINQLYPLEIYESKTPQATIGDPNLEEEAPDDVELTLKDPSTTPHMQLAKVANNILLEPTEKFIRYSMARRITITNPQNPGKTWQPYALFDTGATYSYLDTRALEMLHIKTTETRTEYLDTFGGTVEIQVGITSIGLTATNGFTRIMQFRTMDIDSAEIPIANITQQQADRALDGCNYEYSSTFDTYSIIIGSDYFFHTVTGHHQTTNGSHIILTHFGPIYLATEENPGPNKSWCGAKSVTQSIPSLGGSAESEEKRQNSNCPQAPRQTKKRYVRPSHRPPSPPKKHNVYLKSDKKCEVQTHGLKQAALNQRTTRSQMKRSQGDYGGKWFFLICCLIRLITPTTSLIAYDCSHRNTNITVIDSTSVGTCDIGRETPIQTTTNIQLVQLADTYPVEVLQCKVVISRHISYCGMHSHSAEVLNGHATYIYPVGKTACEELHQTGSIRVQGNILFRDMQAGNSYTRNAVLAGTVTFDGHCEGSFYSDQFGSWNNVLVQATFQIELAKYNSEASTLVDEIKLRSRLICKYSLGYCMDLESGETLWRATKEDSCSQNKHIVLYEGVANVITTKSLDQSTISTYSVEAGQKIFALRTTVPYQACAFTVLKTEHPKLVIVPSQSGNFFFKRKQVPSAAFDLLTFMNTKFIYIDKTIGNRLEDLHYHLSHQRCLTERKTLLTQLALASISPSEFAYAYTNQPGHTANVAGEVIHLAQCNPVEVTVRKTTRCYSELPIVWKNQSMFMAPRSRLIQNHGNELTCNAFIRPMYRLNDHWYALMPDITRVQPPLQINPELPRVYKYESPAGLATGGIYDAEEVERMREQIMHPNERTAITNVVVRGLAGQHPDFQGLSLKGMIDGDALKTIQESLIRKIWGGFTLFGNVISGLVGLLILAKMAKWLIDTLFHGKILYDLYGFSVILLGAMWDSITSYFVHRRTEQTRQRSTRHSTATQDQVTLIAIRETDQARNTESAPTDDLAVNEDVNKIGPVSNIYPRHEAPIIPVYRP